MASIGNNSVPVILQPPSIDCMNVLGTFNYLQNLYLYLSGLTQTTGSTLVYKSTVSAVSSLQLPTIFSQVPTYTAYQVILEDVFCSSGSQQAAIAFSTNGSGFDTVTSHYTTQSLGVVGSTVTGVAGITTSIALNATAILGTTITTSLSGSYLITNPTTTTGYCSLVGQGILKESPTISKLESVAGSYNQTGTSIKGLQIYTTSGNISGTVRIYGLA